MKPEFKATLECVVNAATEQNAAIVICVFDDKDKDTPLVCLRNYSTMDAVRMLQLFARRLQSDKDMVKEGIAPSN